jgi:hypothetical protein
MCDAYLDWLKEQGYEGYREIALMSSARILNGFYTSGTGEWAQNTQPRGDVPNCMSEFAFEFPIVEKTCRGVWVITGYQTYGIDPFTKESIHNPYTDYDTEVLPERLEQYVWGLPKPVPVIKEISVDDIPF